MSWSLSIHYFFSIFHSIGVSESKIVMDATIHPDEEVNIGTFRDAKKLHLGGGVTHRYIVSNDDMIPTCVNMTPHVRDQ